MLMKLDAVNGGAAASDRRPAEDPRLAKAANQFEAMMMKELLAPMARSGDLFTDSEGDQKGILGEFASESLAGALSAHGGLGIADRIIHSLSHSGNSSSSSEVTGKLENNTGISARK